MINHPEILKTIGLFNYKKEKSIGLFYFLNGLNGCKQKNELKSQPTGFQKTKNLNREVLKKKQKLEFKIKLSNSR